MSGTAIISAAGWKGSGFGSGLSGCLEAFLPLGDGTTTLSRAAMIFKKLGFAVCTAVVKRGYPYKKYPVRRGTTPEDMGLSGDDSPWAQERVDYAAQFGEVVEISDPAWASVYDTFCIVMDHLGKQKWNRLVLAMGDMLMEAGYLEAIMTQLPWPSQYVFTPGHSYLLLNTAGAVFFQQYIEPRRRHASWEEWAHRSPYQPAGHPQGSGAMMAGGVPTYSSHNGPNGKWMDIDTPTNYKAALKLVADGTFAWK